MRERGWGGMWGCGVGFCCSAPHYGRSQGGGEEGHAQEHAQERTRECCTCPLATYPLKSEKSARHWDGAHSPQGYLTPNLTSTCGRGKPLQKDLLTLRILTSLWTHTYPSERKIMFLSVSTAAPAEPRSEKKKNHFFCANFGRWKTFNFFLKSAGEIFLSDLRGAKHFSNAFRIVFRSFFSRFFKPFFVSI